MLRRFPPEAIEDAVRTLVDEGFLEITGETPERHRVRLTRAHRVYRPHRESPRPPEPVEAPPVLPPLPFADSDRVLEALRIVVEEASRFVRGEIYLGPFMKRRMNVAFPDLSNEDRKDIVDHLRDLGCVTLERRKGGEGMEYTVMLVDRKHAAVRHVLRTLSADAGPAETPRTFA